jgi:anti-sigma regulatory factor (Ser/Thr protein kinase)
VDNPSVTGAFPSVAPSRRFPPEPASVSQARGFVAEMLLDVDADLIDVAQLLVSELVTNALLHAGSEIEVRVWATRGRLHVRVADEAGDRPLIPRQVDADASTGRGLQLVELLAARYGVDVDVTGKTVWFELWTDVPVDAVRESQWRFLHAGGMPDDRMVHLLELPIPLARAAQRHRDSLLRECTLHTIAHGDLFGVERDKLLQAAAVHDVITEAVTTQIERARGTDPSAETLTAQVAIPAACAPHLAQLRDILDLADLKAREGAFLTRPALPEIRSLRGWLFDEVSRQLAGDPPTPWNPPRVEDQVSGHDVVSDLADVDNSSTAMLAANDDNVIVAANAAALQMLGWTGSDLIGRRIISIIPTRLRERHSIGFTNFLLTGTSRIIGQRVEV